MKRYLTAGFLLTLVFCLAASAQDAADQKVEKTPVSYGLVIDNSGSLRTVIDNVIRVVTDIVDGHGTDDEGFLVTFVDTPKIVLRQEFTDSKPDLQDAVQNMFVEGGQTAILDAVRISAEYLAKSARTDPGRLRALILVTDGEDRESGSKIENVIKLLKEQNIRVFVVAMSDGKIFTKLIDRLTKETGGTKLTPKTRTDLTAAAAHLSAAIRTR